MVHKAKIPGLVAGEVLSMEVCPFPHLPCGCPKVGALVEIMAVPHGATVAQLYLLRELPLKEEETLLMSILPPPQRYEPLGKIGEGMYGVV